MPAKTSETWLENYLGDRISVTAARFDAESNWTVAIDITLSDGYALPTIRDHDHSYATLEEAEVAGFDIAKNVLKSQT